MLFQSLTRDSNHSNTARRARRFTHCIAFQSLTRDSNHSNLLHLRLMRRRRCFNPSRGIAIIQTSGSAVTGCGSEFQSLTRDSNHSNAQGGAHPGRA